MKITMLKAWLAGVAVLVVVYTIWFVILKVHEASWSIVILLWLSPLIAGFISSYIGPSQKILLGTSMAVPTAILAVILNTADQIFDNQVDLPGLQGGLVIFFATLAYAGILSSIGSFIGYHLARMPEGKGNRP